MSNVNQYELGKKLYQDWRMKVEENNSYQEVRQLKREQMNLQELKQGFIDERCTCLNKRAEFEDIECFYRALDEIGTNEK